MVIKHCQTNHLMHISALLRSISSQETCGDIGVPHYFLCLLEVGGEHSMILRDTHGQ